MCLRACEQSRFPIRREDAIMSPLQLEQYLAAACKQREMAQYCKGGRKETEGATYIRSLTAAFAAIGALIAKRMKELGIPAEDGVWYHARSQAVTGCELCRCFVRPCL